MSDENLPATKERVAYDDIDDIIEIAARQKHARAQELSLRDLQEVARDLGIDPEHVDNAVAELDRRRREEAQQQAQRKKQLQVAAAIVAGAALLLLVGMGIDRARLSSAHADAMQQRSQVANVVERHRITAEYFADGDDSLERSAELQGALNRVSIETRRYDEAASQYNRRAAGFPSSVWLGFSELPETLPLSDAIDQW